MYYKITNTDCELYKKLYELVTYEERIERTNYEKVKQFCTPEWDNWAGYHGQGNFDRTTQYRAFKFIDPSKVCLRTWRTDKENLGYYVPNIQTKLGREMRDFLHRGLERSSFTKARTILNGTTSGRFKFPIILRSIDTIILFMDPLWPDDDPNLIEITSKEFCALKEWVN
jgi:hypothetical protein